MKSSRGTLTRIGWRYLVRRPWQTILMILGITLGVAVVIAVDLANESATRAFDLSTAAVAGRASHQITGGPEGLDEQVYVDLRLAGYGFLVDMPFGAGCAIMTRSPTLKCTALLTASFALSIRRALMP